jgi:hypothetical protein
MGRQMTLSMGGLHPHDIHTWLPCKSDFSISLYGGSPHHIQPSRAEGLNEVHGRLA